jgi:SprT protein
VEWRELTETEVNILAGIPPDDAVERKVAETLEKLQAHTSTKLRAPEIKYDLRGHVAGYAIGGHTIRINVELLYTDHYDDMINSTVPHEVCHIAAAQMYPYMRVGHGREWKELMWLIGLPATRCHNYETVAARKRQRMPRPYVYECDCRQHALTAIRHKRVLAGYRYHCTYCRGELEFIGEEET